MSSEYTTDNKTNQIKNIIKDPFSNKIQNQPRHNILDTFLHRIRTDILDESKHTQNKTDNLTRKERLANPK